MNIVFFGSSQFAVPSLEILVKKGHKVSCVITQPDKKKGRGLHLSATAVKTAAQRSSLKIYQPDNINTCEAIKFLKGIQPDLFIVIAYGQILSQQILDIPKILALNIHASLLPKYRGAAPVNWAIINGDTATGITIIKMTKEMDAGHIIIQKVMNIQDEDTSVILEEKLSRLGAELLISSLDYIRNNNYRLIPQDESMVSFAPRLKKEDGFIDWSKSARDIFNLARGCLTWPGAFTYRKGKLLKIYKVSKCQSTKVPEPTLPGEIISVSGEGIVVATGEGNLRIEELQIEGKRRMKAQEFIAGHKIRPGDRLVNSQTPFGL